MRLISNHNLRLLQDVQKKISPLRHLGRLERFRDNGFILYSGISNKKPESNRIDILVIEFFKSCLIRE